MPKPIVTDKAELGALGVRIVDAIVHDKLRWIFRSREQRDLGIDGEIELVDSDPDGKRRRGAGRLIAVQIKCGESFFTEDNGDAFVYRGDPKHLEYWTDFSLPVIIVICHPVTRHAFWVWFSQKAAVRLNKGWKIEIPKANRLDLSNHPLERIADQNRVDDLLDLSIQAWVHTRHIERVEFCGDFAMPRDFHWYDHLLKIGERQVMLHRIYARYGRFEISDLHDALKYMQGNRTYADTLYLCLVAETTDAFSLSADWHDALSGYIDVQTVHLLFDRYSPRVGELGDDGHVTIEYDKGEPIYREAIDGRWVP